MKLRKIKNKLLFNSIKESLKYLLIPIDYTRTKEIPKLFECSGIFNEKRDGLKILDIGSPQLVSLTLAAFNPTWEITYINPFLPELEDLISKKKLLQLKNLRVLEGDITQKVIGGKFDYIFSCSVFEHIIPEESGDITGAKNIKSLIKNQGIFCLSVPFYKTSFNEYRSGDVYAVLNPNNDKIFFQRFYDIESLQNRIIEPSELKLAKSIYIGERFYYKNNINKRLGKLFSNKFISLLLGNFFFLLASVFMTSRNDHKKLSKPYLAILSLVNEN